MPVNGMWGRTAGSPVEKESDKKKETNTAPEEKEEEAATCTVCSRGSHAPLPSLSVLDNKDIVFVLLLVCTGLLLLTVKLLFEVRASLDLVLHLKWGRRARVVYDSGGRGI